ncbi:glycosyltransferase family 2 protein [Rheinheimera aquimaris]|uniref:glycosyltransferase family 2 protein n=1 Tax=Rheinheimera aquimaris TaxID=412437 RepID=UPI003A97663C
MQSQVLLSLVVPFYNAADYLDQLLMSVETQLTAQVQLVLVCDGATDSSLAVAQRHIARSVWPECYMLLSQLNSGVSVARNLGIAHSTGRYVGFVDADDLLLPGYITQVLRVISGHQPDLIEIGFKRFNDISQLPTVKPRYLQHKAGYHQVKHVAPAVFQSNRWFPWLRVYRKAMAPDFRFEPGVAYCEDVMAIPKLYQQAATLYHLRQPLYGYRDHAASASYNVTPGQLQQLQQFYTSLRQAQCYTALPTQCRNLLLLNLVYLFYSLQLNNTLQISLTPSLQQDVRALLLQQCFTAGFSARKKWQLARYFFRHRAQPAVVA